MNFWQGKICPVCHQAFKENDDIVYCPDCGTAHHRDCWTSGGGCFFRDEHAKGNMNTANETVKETASASEQHTADGLKICPACGEKCRPDVRICLNCGYEFGVDDPPKTSGQTAGGAYPPPPGGGYQAGPFPPFGDFSGYQQASGDAEDAGETLEDDVTCRDVIDYCGPDGPGYVQRFRTVRGGKNPFSPAAFFGSFFWLFYRKMIVPGLVTAAAVFAPLMVSVGMVYTTCRDQIAELLTTSENPEQLYAVFEQAIADSPAISVLSAVFWVAALAAMVVCGFFGNRIYYHKVAKDIRTIKSAVTNPTERRYCLARRGRPSLIYPILWLMLLYSLFNCVVMLLI